EEGGVGVDEAVLAERARRAVADAVRAQVAAGIDVVNDGEMSKVSYSTYVNARLTGFEGHVHVPRRPRPDAAAFPRYAESDAQQQTAAARIKRFACTGPVKYVGHAQLESDINNLKAALADSGAPSTEAFMSAASPGVISLFQPNQYYPDVPAYIEALA